MQIKACKPAMWVCIVQRTVVYTPHIEQSSLTQLAAPAKDFVFPSPQLPIGFEEAVPSLLVDSAILY